MDWIATATKDDVLLTAVAVVFAGVFAARVSTWWIYK
jgi:hypothetical protein